MSDELYHHGVKGQKWGIRKEYEKIQRKANRFGTAVAREEKISSAEKKERAIATATTALIAGGMAYLYGKKKWLSSGATAIASGQNKTRLLAAGMAIVGGVVGFSVTAAKQRYAKDQKFKGMDRAAIKTARAIQNNPITNRMGYITSKIGKKAYQLERGFWHSEEDTLEHHGIKGQKWGVRRYQNEDGTLTPEGKERYGKQDKSENLKNVLEDLNKASEKCDKEALKLVKQQPDLKLEYDDGDYEALAWVAKNKYKLDTSKLDNLNKDYAEFQKLLDTVINNK